MIDHVSIGVRDLAASARFYETALAPIGYAKLREKPNTVGFGKRYADFWLNARPGMAPSAPDSGLHICLRAPNPEAVDAFHAAALSCGASDDGAPGVRPEYNDAYYAAFIRDLDGHRVEVVTFLDDRRSA
jgi:catechol 2,3-dioxygenase-like lactoylglutathione lyase family enzyme